MGNVDIIESMNSKYQMETGCSSTNVNKSELDRYFEDACEPHDSNFEILPWWKDKKKKVSHASEFAFSWLSYSWWFLNFIDSKDGRSPYLRTGLASYF